MSYGYQGLRGDVMDVIPTTIPANSNAVNDGIRKNPKKVELNIFARALASTPYPGNNKRPPPTSPSEEFSHRNRQKDVNKANNQRMEQRDNPFMFYSDTYMSTVYKNWKILERPKESSDPFVEQPKEPEGVVSKVRCKNPYCESDGLLPIDNVMQRTNDQAKSPENTHALMTQSDGDCAAWSVLYGLLCDKNVIYSDSVETSKQALKERLEHIRLASDTCHEGELFWPAFPAFYDDPLKENDKGLDALLIHLRYYRKNHLLHPKPSNFMYHLMEWCRLQLIWYKYTYTLKSSIDYIKQLLPLRILRLRNRKTESSGWLDDDDVHLMCDIMGIDVVIRGENLHLSGTVKKIDRRGNQRRRSLAIRAVHTDNINDYDDNIQAPLSSKLLYCERCMLSQVNHYVAEVVRLDDKRIPNKQLAGLPANSNSNQEMAQHVLSWLDKHKHKHPKVSMLQTDVLLEVVDRLYTIEPALMNARLHEGRLIFSSIRKLSKINAKMTTLGYVRKLAAAKEEEKPKSNSTSESESGEEDSGEEEEKPKSNSTSESESSEEDSGEEEFGEEEFGEEEEKPKSNSKSESESSEEDSGEEESDSDESSDDGFDSEEFSGDGIDSEEENEAKLEIANEIVSALNGRDKVNKNDLVVAILDLYGSSSNRTLIQKIKDLEMGEMSLQDIINFKDFHKTTAQPEADIVEMVDVDLIEKEDKSFVDNIDEEQVKRDNKIRMSGDSDQYWYTSLKANMNEMVNVEKTIEYLKDIIVDKMDVRKVKSDMKNQIWFTDLLKNMTEMENVENMVAFLDKELKNALTKSYIKGPENVKTLRNFILLRLKKEKEEELEELEKFNLTIPVETKQKLYTHINELLGIQLRRVEEEPLRIMTNGQPDGVDAWDAQDKAMKKTRMRIKNLKKEIKMNDEWRDSFMNYEIERIQNELINAEKTYKELDDETESEEDKSVDENIRVSEMIDKKPKAMADVQNLLNELKKKIETYRRWLKTQSSNL